MDWPVIFKWTLFSYRNPVYLNLWLWSIYITCVFCLYLLLFIFLLIQLLFFTLYMHVNVKHVNTYIYIYIPKFNFNLTVNMDLVVIFFCSDSLPHTILSSLLTIFWNVIYRQESLPLNSLLRRYKLGCTTQNQWMSLQWMQFIVCPWYYLFPLYHIRCSHCIGWTNENAAWSYDLLMYIL